MRDAILSVLFFFLFLTLFLFLSRVHIGQAKSSSGFTQAKTYQVPIQDLVYEWFSAFKFYTTEIATEDIMKGNQSRAYTDIDLSAKLQDQFKNIVHAWGHNEPKKGASADVQARKVISLMGNDRFRETCTHFLGLFEALVSLGTTNNYQNAEAILEKTKGPIDTPEWEFLYAQVGVDNVTDAFERIERARAMTIQRRGRVNKFVNQSGLKLDADITKYMLDFCDIAEGRSK